MMRVVLRVDQNEWLVNALLAWYAREHRKLPWRAAPGSGALGDPYQVLVSEAMLQQTQVATVSAYFERFLREFPTIQALAAADEQAVLRAWQGLGYYRRARNLHAAARAIVERYDGIVPSELEALRELPGVGPYTAGAIASIAFGKTAAVVDGNVARVIARLHAIAEAVDAGRGRERVWMIAQQLVNTAADSCVFATGDFNQALMELGARVCMPAPGKADCDACPVRPWCAAAERGQVERYPVVAARREPRAVTHRVLVIRRGGKLLLAQRGEDSLWAGMWEMPTHESPGNESESDHGLTVWARERFGIQLHIGPRRGRFTHITTHRRITFELHEATVISGRLRRGAGVWRRFHDMDDLPMSNAQHKALKLVREPAALA